MNDEAVIKKQYILKYNPTSTLDGAKSSAISAAVQHNIVYARNVPQNSRGKIRNYWGTHLEEIGAKFEKTVKLHEYENIICNFQEKMNKKFPDEFNNGSKHGSMFRTSHAQKSIAVYIKILWCMGRIEEPMICPVDRIILNKTNARHSNDIAWGYVNTIQEHGRKFGYIQEAAKAADMSVAKWELYIFAN